MFMSLEAVNILAKMLQGRQIKRTQWHSCAVGHFCCNGLCPHVPLEQSITANQYKLILSDHLYPVMKHLYSDRTGHFLDDSVLIHRTVTDWMRWEWSKSYALTFTVTRSQIRWSPRVGEVLDSVLHHHQ